MGKKKITLKYLAVRLGVSPATISKALRGSPDISKKLQKTVQKLASEVGYRPNLLARTLIHRRSYLLGVVIPDLQISFFTELTRGIYQQARAHGYVAILMVNDENPETERKNLEFLSDLRVDGILLDPVPSRDNHDLYARLVEEDIPIVCYDRRLDEFGISSVTVDDHKAALMLTTEIIHEGRRKILFLGPSHGFSVAECRYQGFLEAHVQANLPHDPDFVVYSDLNAEDSYRRMKRFLTSGKLPDAVFCIGGTVAYGAGNAVLESGFSIPEDMILAEFGDNHIITRLGVPFITVNQNPHEMGKTAVDLLVSEINLGSASQQQNILIDTELVYRKVGLSERLQI